MAPPNRSTAAEAAPLLPHQSSDETSTLGPASSRSSLRSLSPSPSSTRWQSRRRRRNLSVARGISFAAAVLSAVCAGSITVFSLYGHIFQERLRYSQFRVNGVAIAASIASYLPVPFLGYVCDRVGPAPLSLLSSFMFGGGYGLAAGLYRRAATAAAGTDKGHHGGGGPHGWSYAMMVLAFVLIGIGTCSMYLSAVATCAKNFGRGRHRGLALAVPIAAYGLSGMWQSQLGSRVLYERLPDGSRGDVDVFRFFVFLAVLLFVVGIIGTLTLRIVDEEDLIDEAVEELERSGLLDGSALFSPSRAPRGSAGVGGYGTIGGGGTATIDGVLNDGDADADADDIGGGSIGSRLLDPAKDLDDDEEEARLKKQWVLNAETRRFLTDHTMWLFALGFFFMIGPGEAFINNLGTVIKTLYPPSLHYAGTPTSAATHVSLVGITSTVVRLLTGSLTDLLAPRPPAQHVQILTAAAAGPRQNATSPSSSRSAVSRVAFLLFFAVVLSAGLALLASGFAQNHGDRFWVVSGLVGAGYGAVFSLTPIIITVIWGVENFATNWGIVAMFPALGATLWGLVYSAVYQAGVATAADGTTPEEGGGGGGGGGSDDENMCYGTQCYALTFWAMAASVWFACALVVMAWKGRNGWAQRGIVI